MVLAGVLACQTTLVFGDGSFASPTLQTNAQVVVHWLIIWLYVSDVMLVYTGAYVLRIAAAAKSLSPIKELGHHWAQRLCSSCGAAERM